LRGARARLLAGRYTASREALLFFAEVTSLQGRLAASLPANPGADRGFALDSLLPGREPLAELVEKTGPGRLREQARRYDDAACLESLRAFFTRQDTVSPHSFFARVLLQPAMFAWTTEQPQTRFDAPSHAASCPRCGHAPQTGCLRPQGDGTALTLVCSLCLREWPFPRVRCPACAEADHRKISFYSAPEFPHLQVQVCESCRAYMHLVDVSKEPDAIADVDELAALPLDLWALERDYRKVQPNWAGI
jgi:FdhE protein